MNHARSEAVGLRDDMSPNELGRRYFYASALLSLDVTVPFYGLMGLTVREQVPWAECFRAFIRSERPNYFAGEPAYLAKLPSLIVDFIAKWRGTYAARYVAWWVEHIYSEGPQDHANLRAWILLFRAARRPPQTWSQLGLSPRLSAEAKERFNESTNRDEWDRLATQLQSRPLSDWDLHLYAIFQWNDNLPDAPNGPLSMIYPIYSVWKGYEFWRWLLEQLSEDELKNFHLAAQDFLRTNPEVQFLESLENPKAFWLKIP